MVSTVAYQQAWICLSETDQWQHQPLYLVILDHLRRAGITDARILRDTTGLGLPRPIQQTSQIELSGARNVAVTFVDRPKRVTQIMTQLLSWLWSITALAEDGEITVAPISVVAVGRRVASPFPTHLTVSDVMSRDVVSLAPDTRMREIITLLIDQALRSVVVVDSAGHIMGIVTDGDLLTRGGMDLPIDLRQALPLLERAAELTALPDHHHRAVDVMTPNPITLPATTPLDQAAALLAKHDLKRVPVVDDQARLIGMVSRSDLLGTIAERLRQRPTERLPLPAGAPTTVADVMLREVPTADRDTALTVVLDRLLEAEQRRVVVVDDEHRVVGILTDGDVIRRAASRDRPDDLHALLDWLGGGTPSEDIDRVARGYTAADLMTSPAVTVPVDIPIGEATRLLMAHRMKRLPDVDAHGRLVGLVGRAELLRALSSNGTAPRDISE